MRVEQPDPAAPSPALCAPAESPPEPREGAGYPEALTGAERLSQARADAYWREVYQWGERGWEIVAAERERRCSDKDEG
jgi:hypothetical protein